VVELIASLVQKLEDRGVWIDVRDENTVFFRCVPIDERFFSKPRTNVLVKRPRKPLPFVVCVDEDLEYQGSDERLARAFAGAHRSRGWRVLFATENTGTDLQGAVERALGALGFEGEAPEFPKREELRPQGFIERCGENLSEAVAAGQAETTVGRLEEIEDVLSFLLHWKRRLPILVGEPRVGKTNLLHGVAASLRKCRPELELVRVDLGKLFAGTLFDSERENLLEASLKEAKAPAVVLALERFELAFLETRHGPMLLEEAVREGATLIGTTSYEFKHLRTTALYHGISLHELTEEETGEALKSVRDRVARHHGIAIDDSVLGEVLERARELHGPWPEKAFTLLDAASARAVLSGDKDLGKVHVYLAGNRLPENR